MLTLQHALEADTFYPLTAHLLPEGMIATLKAVRVAPTRTFSGMAWSIPIVYKTQLPNSVGGRIHGEITSADAEKWSIVHPAVPRDYPEPPGSLLERTDLNIEAKFAPVLEEIGVKGGHIGVFAYELSIARTEITHPEIVIHIVKLRTERGHKRIEIAQKYFPEPGDSQGQNLMNQVILGRVLPSILADHIEEVEPPKNKDEELVLTVLRTVNPTTRLLEV